MSATNGTKRQSISPRTRFAVLKRDGFACTYCGRTAGGSLTLQVDHVVAIANGGADDLANFVTACNECNAGKGTLEVVSEMAIVGELTTSLVGKFFHRLYPDAYRVMKQGVVEADYGFALRVRFFDWLGGGEGWYWQLVSKAEVASDRWCWYDSSEEMKEAYDYAGFARS